MGDLSLPEGAPERARGHFEKSLEIRERLARLPNDVQGMGDVSLEEGAPERARGYFEQGLAIRELLTRELLNDAGAQRDLVVSLWKLMMLNERAGNRDAARQHHQRCREVLQTMQNAGIHLESPMLQLLRQLTTER